MYRRYIGSAVKRRAKASPSTTPGATASTRIPSRPNSKAHVRASEEIAAAVSGDLRSAGPRLVRLSLTAWDDAADGATFRTLLRWMATDVSAPEAIQNYATEQIAVPMAEALKQSGLSGVSARERATLAGSQLVGLAMIRYVLRLDPIASASVEHLVEVVGPTIQHYLTGPLHPR